MLQLVGALCGAAGGGLTIPTIAETEKWIHPLASSSLLWAAVGLFAGLTGYGFSRRMPRSSGDLDDYPTDRKPLRGFLAALSWALAGAACAAIAWAVVFVGARSFFDASFAPDRMSGDTAEIAAVRAAIGAGYGVLAGAAVGFLRGPRRFDSAFVLGAAGAAFGALGGGFSVLAVASAPRVHPVVSSSLAWAVVGFLMGTFGYLWTNRNAPPTELLDFDEDTEHSAGPKVKWVLREGKGRWRDWAVVRVLPVLLVSAGTLIGAAIDAPSELSAALAAVDVLGLSVAFVLYGQETRIRDLERRSRGPREG